MSEWEPVPERSIRFQRSKHPEVAISEHEEAAWLKEVYKINCRGGNSCKQLDLLEIYAYPNSVLTELPKMLVCTSNASPRKMET